MPKIGTRIYCPSCKGFNVCQALSPTKVGKPKAQRWYWREHQDISWFRRARKCLTCNQIFLSAELDERLLDELISLREKLVKKNKLTADRIRSEKPWLVRVEEVPLELAKDFVRSTAWWHTHSSGQPVRARKHADRVFISSHGWSIEFGANTFLVGKAISRCGEEINKFIEVAVSGDIPEINDLKSRLRLHIRGAVANHDGNEYDGYYPVEGPDMMFGAQSIDVEDGVNFLIDKSGIDVLLGGGGL